MLLLLRLERKQTNSWNPFRVRIFLFLSLILTWNWNDKYLPYTPVVPSKTTPDSRLKWAKCIPVFRPKLRKNPTQWSGTCLYSLHKAVPPGGTPINGLDGFLRVSISIKHTGYHFALVATVFPVWSLLRWAPPPKPGKSGLGDEVALLYQLKFTCVNAQLHEKQIRCYNSTLRCSLGKRLKEDLCQFKFLVSVFPLL